MESLVSFKKDLFGKQVEIVLFEVDNVLAVEVIERAYREGLELSKIFNFFDEGSELSMLNKRRKMKVSDELLEVIKLAKQFSELTNGEYDVSLGKNFRRRKDNEDCEKLDCSYRDIKIDGNEISLSHSDVEIDLGSVAKGYIVDKMVENLKSQGVLSGFVDGRGDIRVFGENEQIIGIQHPRKKESLIGHIKLKDMAVATSGDYNQYNKSFDNCHIINKKEFISVTVVAQTLVLADAIATAVFVSSLENAEKLLEECREVKVMVMDRNLNIKYFNGFENLLTK